MMRTFRLNSFATHFSTFPLLQLFHFFSGQLAPPARFQSAIAQRADPDTNQFADGMAHGFEHAAHLAVASLADRDGQHAVAGAAALVQDRDLRRQRPPSIERDAVPKSLDRSVIRHACNARFVRALDAVARMRQFRREIAVVGQEQQPLGVVVEATHGIDVLPHAAKQIDHGRPSLWIGSRGDVTRRLVEQDVARPFR